MCRESFDVLGLDNERTAYEVKEYLAGIPNIREANADHVHDRIVVDWDETQLGRDKVLTEITYAGCRPRETLDGLVDKIKARLAS